MIVSRPSLVTVLRDEDALDAALVALRALDPTGIGRLVDGHARPKLRTRDAGFAGLLAIVVGQQVSTASAAAILGRVEAAVRPLAAETFAAIPDDTLRACGLSAMKIRTLRAAAEAARTGTLPFATLPGRPAAEVRALLTAVPGIGPWTAEIFLLFCLGHADAWPAGDLAIQEAVRILLDLPTRPGAADTEAIGARWMPYRGAAAYLLWAYYRQVKGRAGAPAADLTAAAP